MIVQAIVLGITIALAAVDSTSWPVTFFFLTMACVVLLNMAAGVYQNLSWATAADLPMKYSNAVMIGCNSVRLWSSGALPLLMHLLQEWNHLFAGDDRLNRSVCEHQVVCSRLLHFLHHLSPCEPDLLSVPLQQRMSMQHATHADALAGVLCAI